jgi:hypothetical protein
MNRNMSDFQRQILLDKQIYNLLNNLQAKYMIFTLVAYILIYLYLFIFIYHTQMKVYQLSLSMCR